jgi:hypothetical protein
LELGRLQRHESERSNRALEACGKRNGAIGYRHFFLPHSSSSSRFTAGAFEFFILSHSGVRPERLVEHVSHCGRFEKSSLWDFCDTPQIF